MKKNVTKVVCPKCGCEMEIPEHEQFTAGVAIGKDSGLGTVYLKEASDNKQTISFSNNQSNSNKMTNKAQERINALREAGINVDNLFAMQGAAGGDILARMENGQLSVVDDDDPIFQAINKGYIPNRDLFRRHVTAQMFRFLSKNHYWSYRDCKDYTSRVHSLGYDYTWKTLVDEFKSQYRMYRNQDNDLLSERQIWFNKDVAISMATEYISLLEEYVNEQQVKRCKRVPYKRIGGRNVFVSDIDMKVFKPLRDLLMRITKASNPMALYYLVKEFSNKRIKLHYNTAQNKDWFDAFKGSGSYYTMQNLIRFHGCFIADDGGYKMTKGDADKYLFDKAMQYRNEGWRLFGLMKKFIADNKIDVDAKIESWRK